MSKEVIEHLLRAHNILPNELRGQHFLWDDEILDSIVRFAAVQKTDAVLEIGGGIGNLTSLLAQKAGRVVCVEIDERFRPALGALERLNGNLTVVFGDFMQLDFAALASLMTMNEGAKYSVVANIPYYLTSKILERLLHVPVLPSKIVVLIQQEVAERICARAGSHSKLSLAVQLHAEPSIVRLVGRKSFVPSPDVDSAVLMLSKIRPWRFDAPESLVWRIIRIGFSSRRKTLENNLVAGLRQPRERVETLMRRCDIGTRARAQELTQEQWLALAAAFNTPR